MNTPYMAATEIYNAARDKVKHEVTSLNTKNNSGFSQEIHGEKPLSKKVSEIAAECRTNRKTFYYYFDDSQTLLKWSLEAVSCA